MLKGRGCGRRRRRGCIQQGHCGPPISFRTLCDSLLNVPAPLSLATGVGVMEVQPQIHRVVRGELDLSEELQEDGFQAVQILHGGSGDVAVTPVHHGHHLGDHVLHVPRAAGRVRLVGHDDDGVGGGRRCSPAPPSSVC